MSKEAESNFTTDVEQEKIICQSVYESYLIPDYCNAYNATIDQIIMGNSEEEKVLQFAGVDFIAKHKDGTKRYIDLKAQTNGYINNPTNTFCLELDYLKDGKRREGWFLDKDKITTHWLFMWINESILDKSKRKPFINNSEDILNYKLMLIDVSKTKKWLESFGISENFIRNVVEGMRSEKGKRKINAYNKKNGMNYSKSRVYYDLDEKSTCLEHPYIKKHRYVSFVESGSNELCESPINLVINNRYWEKIADEVHTEIRPQYLLSA